MCRNHQGHFFTRAAVNSNSDSRFFFCKIKGCDAVAAVVAVFFVVVGCYVGKGCVLLITVYGCLLF